MRFVPVVSKPRLMRSQDRAPEGLAPKVEFPEGEIPLTGKVPGTAEQVAELAPFLASDASSHILARRFLSMARNPCFKADQVLAIACIGILEHSS